MASNTLSPETRVVMRVCPSRCAQIPPKLPSRICNLSGMLLNYSTTVPLARTLAEIAKAIPVPVTFEREHGRVVALTFRYGGEFYPALA